MDERRAYLKQLAARSARRWSSAPLPPCFAGETGIETRNTAYLLRDGVCYAVTRHAGAAGAMSPSVFVGMRAVGWLMRDDPDSGIKQEWKPGAYAVLWRPRLANEEHSAVALTSTSLAFGALSRGVPTPRVENPESAGTGRLSPIPLPFPNPRETLLPRPPLVHVPPPPASTTRLHVGLTPDIPAIPPPVLLRILA
jgi:hypothetical protein